MNERLKINNIVIIGGNIYRQDFPIINIINALKKYKTRIFIITDKARVNYPNKKYKSFRIFLKEKKLEYKIFDDYSKMSIFLNKTFNSSNTLILSCNNKWLIKKDIINKYKYLFNYHNADLPSQRGAACHSWGIMMKKNFSSLNIHLVGKEFDIGNIVLTKKYELGNSTSNLDSIYKTLKKKEENFFNKFFSNFFNKKLSRIIQDNKKSFYWPKLIQKKNSYVDWNWSAENIRVFCNAFDNPFKGVTAIYKKTKILLHSARLADREIIFHPFQYGMIYRKFNKKLYVATCKGGISFKLHNVDFKKIKLGYKFYN